MQLRAALTLLFVSIAAPAFAERTPAPENAEVYLVQPIDGAVVTSPVTVVFGLRGAGIAPAGVELPNTGHHHLLINVDPATIDFENPLPASDELVHFGGGQTETTLDLPAGEHSLQLLFGDHNHIPHEPPVLSEPVTINVQ
ncbi:MAG: DUF4399 domain-containing protein [Pseudomonadota bacterium]